MSPFTLVIGNKNYSSWSLRPWLVLKQVGIEFTEIRIPLYTETAPQELLSHSPVARVPILHHGDITIWESIAICEYLVECFPDIALMPKNIKARAFARSISAEMHAGFQNLRQNMPMNCRAKVPGKGMETGVQEDIDRITSIWRNCREIFGNGGNLLFGDFTIADAMFAPVVLRFATYGVELDSVCQSYADAILNLPSIQEWIEAAKLEKEVISKYEF